MNRETDALIIARTRCWIERAVVALNLCPFARKPVAAELSLAASGIRETFTTRNRLTPFERIEMVLVSGPFRELSGGWTFTRLGDDAGCRVALELDFQLSGVRSLLGSVFSRAADQMVDAFCARANELLGST